MSRTTLHPPATNQPLTDALLQAFCDSTTIGVHMGRGYEGLHVTYANDAFLSMLGYTRDDFEAGTIGWFALTPPECIEADLANVNNLNTLGATPAYAKQYLHKNGTPVDVWMQLLLIPGTKEDWICYMVRK